MLGLKAAWLEGNRRRKQQSGCLHTRGLGLFLFTEASGPGVLLAPHLLLDALLATVAKIVLSPSASAQSALPQALFCKPIVLLSPLCVLPLDHRGVWCWTWTSPVCAGVGCGSASFGERVGRGLCRWPWLFPHFYMRFSRLSGLPECGGRLPRLSVLGWQAPLLRIPKCNSSRGDSLPAVLARLPDILRLLQILFIYTGGFGLCELSSFS